MRKLASLLLLCLALGGCGGDERGGGERKESTRPAAAASEFRVAVDHRVELLSILCRLAGVPPYQQAATAYAAAVDRQFGEHAQHPAVTATRELTREHGISYDAPVELAAYLDESFGPARRLEPLPPGLDPRWEGVDLDEYLRQVRGFATDSGFAAFMRSQSAYHREVETAIGRYLAGKPVVDWFDSVLGPRRDASYRVVPGLLTGGYAFGTTARTRDGVDVAQILFLEQPDERGVPRPTGLSLEYLAHELAHSYVNPIFDPRAERMRAAAQPVFRRVEGAMRSQAYTSFPIMVNESVVRALVILFLRERASRADVERSLAQQQELSFVWTPELVEAIARERPGGDGRVPTAALVRATQRVLRDWLAEQR